MAIKNDSFYKNLNTVLLSFISVFGVFSIVLLINVNNKLNKVITENAVQDSRIERLEKDLAELKN